MPASPPEQAAEFRGKTLTPVSPKPVLFPSPANIPILEKQMDPMFNESSFPLDLPGNYSAVMHAEKVSSRSPSADSLYPEQTGPSDNQVEAVEGNGNSGGYIGSYGTHIDEESDNLDTPSIHSFSPNQSPPAHANREAASDPMQADGASAPSYDPTVLLDDQDLSSASPTANPSAQDAAHSSNLDTALDSGAIQALLDNLSPSYANPPMSLESTGSALPPSAATNAASSRGRSPVSTLPSHPNLPPRPPPQEKPATHPNYAPEDDIRSYHPHSQKAPAASYRAQSGLAPLMTAGAHTATPAANGLTPSFQQNTPVSATQQGAHSPNTPAYRQRDPIERRPDPKDDEEASFGPELNKVYEDFLREERVYVTEGQWDKFPNNSRLFIGNLPTEKVSKRDLFQIFYKHGKLAQVSIKQAYGFVQFLDSNACYHALQNEQGTSLRGRKIHLEISKPQKNTRGGDSNTNNARGGRRRSRSPDYNRGGTGGAPRGVDRYTSGGGAGGSPREREFRRARDDYRPGRSPSPRGYRGGRGRDRSRDRYDGRRRSRSHSPFGRGGERYRSPTPRREVDDDLPLPRRAPKDVPDVQIIVLDDLDRNFIAWIEKGFQDRGIRCDVLILSPRLSEDAVIRRQILEGVIAVSRLQRPSQQLGTIPLRIFDRRGGVDNVQFEDYENLAPNICAELVVRAKQTHSIPAHAPVPAPAYGVPPAYGLPQGQYGLPPTQAMQPQQAASALNPQNLSNLISSLDGAALQQLLGAMQHQQVGQQPQQPQASLTTDLARLLGGSLGPGQASLYGQAPSNAGNPANPYAALAANPAFASLMNPQGAPQHLGAPAPNSAQASQGGQPDMQEIMAQLAKYRR